MSEQGFWVVWNPKHGNPRFRHDTEEEAAREARRLASMNPGQQFYVLYSVSVTENNAIITRRLECPLPF